jgi:hypothetical protein
VLPIGQAGSPAKPLQHGERKWGGRSFSGALGGCVVCGL